jgi:hypothetical protein
MIKKDELKVIKRTVIPVEVVQTPNITAVLNFHKPRGSAILPADITTNLKKIKISFKNDERGEEIRRGREVKSYDILVASKKFPDSRFSTELPYEIKRKEAEEVYFGLKMDKRNGSLKILDGYAEMSERIIEKRTAVLTFNQKLKIQESMMDNRMKRQYTEKEVMEMFDEDNDIFDR